jgi:ribosomal protein L11 methyltransferase
MGWLQLALVADRDQADLLEAALENGGALAVTIDAAADGPGAELVLEPAPDATPLWRQVRITALFDDDPHGRMLAERAAVALGPQSLTPPLIEPLDDRPWERVWLEQATPMRFGERLWVCPVGQRPDSAAVADSEPVIIELDPGLAFGTGHHPTTALCLRWLDRIDLRDRVILDYGCGSGILAIAALKLGARQAIAVDHDQQALDASVDNALANGVLERLAVAHPDRLPPLAADVIAANILAGPLVELAPTLTGLAKPDARIGLSGILTHQADKVAAAYQSAFLLQPPESDGDWVLLEGRRARD